MHLATTAQINPAQQRVETANAHAPTPIMLAHDRRGLDVPLEERRISNVIAWAKTMFPVIDQSTRDVCAQLHIGYHDIRIYFSDTTAATEATTTTPANATEPSTARTNVLLLGIR
jgi:hypothetical protein